MVLQKNPAFSDVGNISILFNPKDLNGGGPWNSLKINPKTPARKGV
jgi:hypothetical protein